MKFTDWKIGTRLGSCMAFLLALMVSTGGIGLWSLKVCQEQAVIMRAVMDGEQLMNEWKNQLGNQDLILNSILGASDAEHVARLNHIATAQMARADEIMRDLRAHAPPEAQKALDVIQRAGTAFHEKRRQLLRMHNPADMKSISASQAFFDQEVAPLLKGYSDAVSLMKKTAEADTRAAKNMSDATYARAQTLLLVCSLVTILLGAGLGWMLARSITGPIAYAVEVADTVADGNLGNSIVFESRDEIGILLHALQRMQQSLVTTVSAVRQSAQVVADGSAQIAASNNELSARTEEQAGVLEETAAAMEELGSTVKQNADNTEQASQLARTAATVASEGSELVAEVVMTMRAINESSSKVNEIIGVIDGIAFQTNILALNAAVEAARAGEQGRGFAVVASEVRSLAQRSSGAAKEIKELITSSVERVTQGALLVDRAGNTMNEIVSAIRHASEIMMDISTAGKEQSAGVSQVGKAVIQMDQATQENAAMVEEMAASADVLNQQVRSLVETVAMFKLPDASSGVDHLESAGPALKTVRPQAPMALAFKPG